MKSNNPKQALTLIDETLPTTVIDSILKIFRSTSIVKRKYLPKHWNIDRSCNNYSKEDI